MNYKLVMLINQININMSLILTNYCSQNGQTALPDSGPNNKPQNRKIQIKLITGYDTHQKLQLKSVRT